MNTSPASNTEPDSVPAQPITPAVVATSAPNSTPTPSPDPGPSPSPSPDPSAAPLPALAPDTLTGFNRALGVLDLRSPAEDAAYFECEEIIRSGWRSFVQVGLALGRIRDETLYRNEYKSFPNYCRERWGFQAAHAYRLIAAARLSKFIASLPVTQPDHETQLRPLTGLKTDDALTAWQDAALMTPSNRMVTPALVKRAIRQLHLVPVDPAPGKKAPDKEQRYKNRQHIRAGFNDLLSLLLAKAAHDVLIDKVQELQRHVDLILGVRKKRK